MKIDTGNLNPGTWFDIPGDTGRICLRSLSFDDAARIRKATTKVKTEYKNGQRFEFEDTDDEKAAEMTWDACIVDWDGLTGADDAPIPCTSELKIKLMRNEPKFARIVSGMIEKLKQAEAVADEADLKN